MIRRAIVGAVIVAASFGTGVFVASDPIDPAQITGTYSVPTGTLTVYADTSARFAPERIWEDDPRFDCATMGNRSCGDSRP